MNFKEKRDILSYKKICIKKSKDVDSETKERERERIFERYVSWHEIVVKDEVFTILKNKHNTIVPRFSREPSTILSNIK